MYQAMLPCNGVQTQVIAEGRWVEEGLAPLGYRDLVIVIPGNPGVPGFYARFIEILKRQLPTEVPVWAIGHAGHVQPPQHLTSSLSSENSTKNLFNLNGQIKHKMEFIKQYVPKEAKIHIIAHSIGAWFSLKLLQDEELAKRIIKCYFLFPTIEHMVETPSGKFLKYFLPIFSPIFIFLAWVLSFLPQFIQAILIQIFGRFFGITHETIEPALQLVNPSIVNRVLKLAIEELETVREMDHEIIEKNAKKIFLYYGATDNWTPITYYQRFKIKHPTVQAELCKRGFRHAFVLNNAKDVGIMIGDMINKSII